MKAPTTSGQREVSGNDSQPATNVRPVTPRTAKALAKAARLADLKGAQGALPLVDVASSKERNKRDDQNVAPNKEQQ